MNPHYLEMISTLLTLNKLLITQYYVFANKYKDMFNNVFVNNSTFIYTHTNKSSQRNPSQAGLKPFITVFKTHEDKTFKNSRSTY